MKKSIFGLAMMLLFTSNVYAVDVTSASELDTCIATTGNTCVLKDDVSLTSQRIIEEGKDITLDLNGHTISYTGTSTLASGVFAIKHGGKLTINDSGSTGKIVSGSKAYAAIAMTVNKTDIDNTKVAELVVNGGNIVGDYYAITGNGSTGRDNTKITINGGKIEGSHTDDNLGIYHPQAGEIIINGGEVTGGTGIEIRAGKLTVNGGTITGTYVPLTSAANGSGTTTNGAGIAVMQHTTALETKVVVNGGTVKGYVAVAQKNIQNLAADKVALVSISLTGGTFEAINGGTEVVSSENKTEFITGGTYNKSIASSYIPTDYKVEETDGKYVVSPNKSVEASTSEGTVSFESEETIDTTYVLVVTKKDETTTTNVETKVKELLKEKTDTTLISLYEIDVKDNSNEVVEMSNGSYTISIPVPEDMKNFSTYKVVYVNEQGEIAETLNASLVDGKIVFTTTHLSTYGIVGYNETNPNTGDGIISSVVLASISLISLTGAALYLKKSKRFN